MGTKEYHKDYYIKNKERISELARIWRETNREKDRKFKAESYHRCKNDPKNIKHYLLKNAKARAKQKGLDFSLTDADITLPEKCPILGVVFDRNSRRYAYSLDRIDPKKGYTKENVWVISQIANAMKWDSTVEERLAFANWVLSSQKGGET